METKTVTITITDHTQPGRSLLDLITNGSGAGYTVAPAAGYGQTNITNSIAGRVSYCSVQSSPGNGQNYVYTGDDKTANDGTRQGKELQAGDVDVFQAYPETIFLTAKYLRAGGDNVKVNVEIHYS